MARTRRPAIDAQNGPVEKALDPYTDGSVSQPILEWAPMSWSSLRRDIASTGLRQWGGYVREEYLPQLRGRELTRTYREMIDGNATVGAVMFAITSAMRAVRWREIPANDTAEAKRWAEFAESLRNDMSTPWENHVVEVLSMLGYGYHISECVYKKREGRKNESENVASSRYKDGLIGWRRLPTRGQDTILRWYFDTNGQTTGVQQMPWVGRMIDLPIQKFLLFRPLAHKNSPEGRSVLRNAVRPHHFIKRLEEMEAILFERLSGLPTIYAPQQLIAAAQSGKDAAATAAYAALQKMVTNIKIGEQMGLVLPSDLYPGVNGPSTQRMYDFQLVTPNSGHIVDPAPMVQRYKLDTLKTVLADFIDLGHQARGTQNLAITKMDMFYKGIEGWLHSIAAVHNRYGLDRIWQLNGLDDDLMPRTEPDMASRIDLQELGNFVFALARSGIDMTDPDIEDYLRNQSGMPELTDEDIDEKNDLRDLQSKLVVSQRPGTIFDPRLEPKPAASASGGKKKPANSNSSNGVRQRTNVAKSASEEAAEAVLGAILRGTLRERKKNARPIPIGRGRLAQPKPLANGHDPAP